MSKSVVVYLSVGSNCGDRSTQVASGSEWLKSILQDSQISSIYSTGDCHGGPRDYHNAVVKGKTEFSPEQLEILCKYYEKCHGRNEDARKHGDVPIDIDVVKYDGKILRPKDYYQNFFRLGYDQLQKCQDGS